MPIFKQIDDLFWYAIVAIVISLIVLMLVRFAVIYADLNPFSWLALTVRRLTDPLVGPVQRGLARAGLDPKLAPLVMILIACLLGYFAIQLVSTVTHTTNGVILSLTGGDIVRVIGFLLFGLLAIYSLLIFMRIVFSWGSSSANRLTRFLIRATEPVMGPFRRMIPPLGMFDISPIVVLLLIQLLQQAVFGVFRLY